MEQTAGQPLQGKRVAMLLTDGVEQVEYTAPRSFLEQQGAQVTLVSPKSVGEHIQGVHHDTPADTFPVELDVREASPRDFDALVLPGGADNPERLRQSQEAIAFIREFGQEDKPIAAICHGPLTLIDAGIAESKHVTSWPTVQDDLKNAGAEWTDEEVVIDGKLITSRNPDDIPAFNRALLQQLTIDTVAADTGPSS